MRLQKQIYCGEYKLNDPEMNISPSSRIHTHQFDEGKPAGAETHSAGHYSNEEMMLLEAVGGWISQFNGLAKWMAGICSSHMLAIGLAHMAYRAACLTQWRWALQFCTWKIGNSRRLQQCDFINCRLTFSVSFIL